MYRLDILPFVICLLLFANPASHQCEQRIFLKEKKDKEGKWKSDNGDNYEKDQNRAGG